MSGTNSSSGSRSGFIPPAIEELNAALDQYEFLELIGQGGMGAIYKARQTSLDRLVAIKILPADLATEEEGDGEDEFQFTARFQREARAMAKLTHPNIIGVYDFGQTRGGLFYIAIEYVEGTDLNAIIQTGGLTIDHVVGWTTQICAALQYAHDHGIVHRDIKPANIMINVAGEVKVADFGLAKLTDADEHEPSLTMTNVAMGTPNYVAPEVLDSTATPDHRADLYAVGVMLYEMLTGRVPRGAWKSPSSQIEGLDPRYDELVARAMDSDPSGRFQNASQISSTIYDISVAPVDLPATDPGIPLGEPHSPDSRLLFRDIEHLDKMPPAPAPVGKKKSKALPITIAAALVVGLGIWIALPEEEKELEVLAALSEEMKPEATSPSEKAAPDETRSAEPNLAEAPVASEMPPVDSPETTPERMLRQVEFESNTSRYRFVPEIFSWNTARLKARELGGYLAVLETQEEMDLVAAALLDVIPTKKAFALGAHVDETGMFTWVTGMQSDTNFADICLDHIGTKESGFFGSLLMQRAVWEKKGFSLRKQGLTDRVNEDFWVGYLIEWEKNPQAIEPVEFTFEKSRYRFVPSDADWTIARKEISSTGGQLASIGSETEQKAICEALKDHLPPRKGVLIGGLVANWETKKFSETPMTVSSWTGPNHEEIEDFIFLMRSSWNPDEFLTIQRRTLGTLAPDSLGYLVEWEADEASAELQTSVKSEAPAPSDARLLSLKNGFDTRYAADAEAPYRAAQEKLEKSYLDNGIAKARAAAQKKGDLAEVTSLDEAKTQMARGEGVPETDDSGTPESLKKLNQIYRQSHAKLLGDRTKRAAPLYAIYLEALDSYVTDLTRENEIEKAREVSEFRNKIAAKSSTAEPLPPVAPQPKEIVETPSHAALPEPEGTPREQIRTVSEWILAHGGTLIVEGRDKMHDVKIIGELPNGALKIVTAEVHTDRLTPATMALFGSLKDLNKITLIGEKSKPLDFLTSLPALTSLTCDAGVSNDSWSVIGSLKNLQRLAIQGLIEDSEIALLTGLQSLLRLSIEMAPTGIGFSGMTGSGDLKELRLGDNRSSLSDEGVVAIAASFPDLERVTLGAWDQPAGISTKSFPAIEQLDKLIELRIPGEKIDDSALPFLAGLKSLEVLSLGGTSVTGIGIGELKKLKNLVDLELWQAPIDNEALVEIAELKSLKRVILNNTPVKDSAVAELRSTRPDMDVVKLAR